MPKHTKQTKEDGIEIAFLLKSNKFNQTQIARQLGKSKSTISSELSRNKEIKSVNYSYSITHKLAKERKVQANKSKLKSLLKV